MRLARPAHTGPDFAQFHGAHCLIASAFVVETRRRVYAAHVRAVCLGGCGAVFCRALGRECLDARDVVELLFLVRACAEEGLGRWVVAEGVEGGFGTGEFEGGEVCFWVGLGARGEGAGTCGRKVGSGGIVLGLLLRTWEEWGGDELAEGDWG
jgi:hypothetical protein